MREVHMHETDVLLNKLRTERYGLSKKSDKVMSQPRLLFIKLPLKVIWGLDRTYLGSLIYLMTNITMI